MGAMPTTELRKADSLRGHVEQRDGWATYREALHWIDQTNWTQALNLFAEAETLFRINDDRPGLWRVLLGQTLVHWHTDAPALALARVMAALRVAHAAEDSLAVGFVAWQAASIVLSRVNYREAASFLSQAQTALDDAGAAPPGGVLAAASQLCIELLRWQQMSQHNDCHDVDAMIAEARRELAAHLQQATEAMHALEAERPAGAADTALLIAPMLGPPTRQLAADTPRPSLRERVACWWSGRAHASSTPDLPPVALLPPMPRIEPPLAETLSRAVDTADESAPKPRAQSSKPVASNNTPPVEQHALAVTQRPGLAIHCFGNFRVYVDDAPIERWESARGRAIFKYLITRRTSAAPKELLAALFWPDSEPELARRSLHQAIYCIRQTFKHVRSDRQIIQFVDDRYQINPALSIWLDTEAFEQAIERAHAATDAEHTIKEYAVAVDLYSAEFLPEDRYEEWSSETRRRYQALFTEALHGLAHYHYERQDYPAAIMLSQRALMHDICDEEAHHLLIACYMAQGLRHLAVRQYKTVVNALKTELGLEPSEDIEAFYQTITGGV